MITDVVERNSLDNLVDTRATHDPVRRLILERLQKQSSALTNVITHADIKLLRSIGASSDTDFMLGLIDLLQTETVHQYSSDVKKAIKRCKAKHDFLKEVNDAGVLKTVDVSNFLDVSKPAVNKKKANNQLFAIVSGNVDLFPAFQFNLNAKDKQSKIVFGLSNLLSLLTDESSVSKYEFFTCERDIFRRKLSDGKKYRICDMLKNGVDDEELSELKRLAAAWGTNVVE